MVSLPKFKGGLGVLSYLRTHNEDNLHKLFTGMDIPWVILI
jgi:hypothetical protein